MFPLTFCLSSIFMAKYCSVPLCFTSMTLPNEPVPRVFNLSKSSRHVVLCENNHSLVYSVGAATKNTEFFIIATCGGHSHFRRKSSLALARNSFTKKKEQRQTKSETELVWCLELDYWHEDTLGFKIKVAKRPNAIILEGERKKCGEWK